MNPGKHTAISLTDCVLTYKANVFLIHAEKPAISKAGMTMPSMGKLMLSVPASPSAVG